MSRLINWIELLSYWCFYSNFNDVVEGYTGLRIFENAVQHKFYSSIQFEPSKMKFHTNSSVQIEPYLSFVWGQRLSPGSNQEKHRAFSNCYKFDTSRSGDIAFVVDKILGPQSNLPGTISEELAQYRVQQNSSSKFRWLIYEKHVRPGIYFCKHQTLISMD